MKLRIKLLLKFNFYYIIKSKPHPLLQPVSQPPPCCPSKVSSQQKITALGTPVQYGYAQEYNNTADGNELIIL